MALTLAQINAADAAAVGRLLAGVYEHAPWVVERALARRPAGGFASLAALKLACVAAVREASPEEQLALIRAQAELDSAALAGCSSEELAQLQQLDDAYRRKFGWPCVLALRGPRGTVMTPGEIIASLARRLENHPDFERAECLRNIHRVAELRLNDTFGHEPEEGNRILDWAAQLAAHSDPGFREQGQLTVTYQTEAHQACARDLAAWMRECGFDEVARDAVGNVVGIYHGTDRAAPRLLTGSHFDTVRNGGRYDGRLGIFVPMACVRALAQQRRRLPFGIELVAFAEEEGQRYKATFLGSGALTGDFDPAWLSQCDADGVTLQQAMRAAGLSGRIEDIAALERDPRRYLGFVEVHIEQGPVLDELDLPLAVVTSINGGLRYVVEIVGMASHAGTTPMDRRRDASAAAAELVLYVERRARAVPDTVGTVGILQVPSGSINVVPGRCRLTLDLRASTDAARDALAAAVIEELEAICRRRGLHVTIERTMAASAAPSDPAWQRRWERAVAALGLPVHRMPSGAGHDAMKLHEIMPQAMLFVRGLNAGISHNPLEAITNDDAELAVRAFGNLLEGLAQECA